ncbi:MAG: hypothetical protein ETSY2_35825 [Candidatus Entotheonella gemina]|uniref:Uncharacterized protein n=2 Tax=Candidatus Entotheonella TaxID=93171 RepID=W4LX28_9BACT|nr:MAG: hypothetical protein ETSY2_35825 [Candidatus Entotheonella gemina]
MELSRFAKHAARAVRDNESVSFDTIMKRATKHGSFKVIQPIPDSFEVIQSGVILQVRAEDSTGKMISIWIYTKSDPTQAPGPEALESSYFELPDRVKKQTEAHGVPSFPEAPRSVSSDVIVRASTNEATVRMAALDQLEETDRDRQCGLDEIKHMGHSEIIEISHALPYQLTSRF